MKLSLMNHRIMQSRRPVSISSWPTLDPLDHPTEIYTDEDKESIDIKKISGKDVQAGTICHISCLSLLSEFYKSISPPIRSFSDE